MEIAVRLLDLFVSHPESAEVRAKCDVQYTPKPDLNATPQGNVRRKEGRGQIHINVCFFRHGEHELVENQAKNLDVRLRRPGAELLRRAM